LQTAGWEDASPEARRAFEAAVARLVEAGIAIADRHSDPSIEEVEGAIADAAGLTRQINAWEGRWPLNTYRNRDRSKLSQSALDRLATAEAMTLADYGAAIARRQRNREVHARLAGRYERRLRLRRRALRRLGSSTGNPVFNACPPRCSAFPPCRCRCCRSRAAARPADHGLCRRDADLFAIGAAVRDLLGAMPSQSRSG
jgi:hypothetical protein